MNLCISFAAKKMLHEISVVYFFNERILHAKDNYSLHQLVSHPLSIASYNGILIKTLLF